MNIDDVYRLRQIVNCSMCANEQIDLCLKLLNAEERNQYAEKYGCICGCKCICCLNKGECENVSDD